MAKCEITSDVLNELETQINNDLYNIDPDEELSSDEFLTQCKDYFNTKLKGNDGKYHSANVTIVVQNDNEKTTWRIITLTPGKKTDRRTL